MTTYEKIELLRKERGMSQRKLEETLGFSNGSISKWKKSAPSPDRLQKIAAYFDVSVDYLLDKETELPRRENGPDNVKNFSGAEAPEVLILYERLDAEDKARILDIMRAFLLDAKYSAKIKNA